ncbi:MAG: hypothetical protein OEO82_02905 [Gammaproteobacteria bacterium]|nr:hypothetical protein [Gammaproteobacteria bacterium]
MMQHRALLLLAALAALLVMLGVALIALSTSGRALFGFVDDAPRTLAPDEPLRAWITFDRPSYRLGEIASYRIRIRWRDALANPDLETFATSIGFYPFDQRDSAVNVYRLGGGQREYVADYLLQAVNVETASTYQLDTASVYYTLASDGHTELHSYRVSPPPVHIGEFYPGDIASVALRPLKPAIDDARALRRGMMASCGLALLAILLVLLWQRGRRRPYAELSAEEQLWRDFDALRRAPQDDRQFVVAYEQLFTRALELRDGVTPLQFWSGAGLARGELQDLIAEARLMFGQAYRPEGPAVQEVERIVALIDSVLLPMVAEERLQREIHDDFFGRLRQQPAVMAASGMLLVAVLAAFTLAALPSMWLAADFRQYNAAVELLSADGDLQQAADAFSALSEVSDDTRVRSAALYNLGTLLADRRMTRLAREQHANFLQAMFLPEVTLGRLLHDMELDAEFELVTLLTELTRQYAQAEQALKAAVRAAPTDPDAGRNLELLGKLLRAIARSIAQLVQQGEDSVGTQQMLSQTIIDLKLLMEAELPDDYAKIDAGKDDRDYFIMERF